MLLTAVFDIEDLVRVGKECGGCPFYATRDMMAAVDVVFCPYNYIIDPNIRKSLNIRLSVSRLLRLRRLALPLIAVFAFSTECGGDY